MIVCHCNGITDSEIRRAAKECGRDGLAVSQRCGAGTACRGCLPTIQALLQRLDSKDQNRQRYDERR